MKGNFTRFSFPSLLRVGISLIVGVLFGLLLMPSLAKAQTCTGNGNTVVSSAGVTTPNSATGAPDGAFADLYDLGDEVVLGLDKQLASGATLVVTWRGSSASNPANVSISTSVDGITYTPATGSPFTVAVNAAFFTTNVVIASDAIYVKFKTNDGFNVDLDAMTYTNQSCSPLMYFATPHYYTTDPLAAGSNGADDQSLLVFPCAASGGLGSGGTPIYRFAKASQVGATWGLGTNTQTGKIYSAAFLKRHVGLGPNGLGAIYVSDMTTGNATTTPMTTSLFLNLVTAGIDVGQTQVSGMDLSNAAASNIARGLLADQTQNTPDLGVFSKIGKIGLGDLDIDEGNQNIYVVNLFLKKIHKVSISGATVVASYDIPSGDGAAGSTMRPFGLEIKNGKLYAGVVYTKENPATFAAQDTVGMKAAIYELNLGTGTWTAGPFFSFPLTYPKGDIQTSLPDIDNWDTWQDNFGEWEKHQDLALHPQPILSDIEMDNTGAFHIGLMDRAGHMIGNDNNSPDASVYSGTTSNYSGGDILRTAKVGSTLVMESNGSAGTFTGAGVGNGRGNGEFYSNENKDAVHLETSWGGLALKNNNTELALTLMDPFSFTAGGIKTFSTANGSVNRSYEIYVSSGSNSPTFGKANGLGDLELAFISSCVTPTALVTSQTPPTCTGATPDNNGKITVTAITNADKYGVSLGATYTGVAYAAAAALTPLPKDVQTSIPNTGATYTIRLFNGANDCFKDTTFIVAPVTCGAGCTNPSGITFTQSPATCLGINMPANNGSITLVTASNGTYFGISTLNAATYDGPTTIAAATAITLPQLIKNAIPNTGGTYIVRVFNGADGCFTDVTVTAPTIGCACPTLPCGGTTAVKN